MNKKRLLFVILTFTIVALSACTTTHNPTETQTLRLALLIEDASPELDTVFEDFRLSLEEHIGMPVQVIEGATHLVGIEAMRAGNLDVMWGSPFVYLLAQRDIEVERLAVTSSPTAVNNTLFITANDNIQIMEDLPGHSFAFTSLASASGFVYPMYHLMNLFNMERDDILAGDFFSAVTMSGGGTASIMGVVHGDFDAAAVGNLNFQSLLASGMISEEDTRIIGQTEIIPFPGYIASKRLPAELRASIREFIIAYDNVDYFIERFENPDVRFVEPDPHQIEHLRSMVAALDIDLEEQG